MSTSDIITLISGFGGVLIGAGVSYFAEYRFRKSDRERQIRIDFNIIMLELGKVYDKLTSFYTILSKELPPDKKPDMIVVHVREIASTNMQPISINLERVFSLSDKEDNVISEIMLCFRRYNSIINTIESVNNKKTEMFSYYKDHTVGVKGGDVAVIEFKHDDYATQMDFVRIENLYRDIFKQIICDIEHTESLIMRVNAISKRKFRKPKNENPELTFESKPKIISYLKDMDFFDVSQLPRSDK